MDVKLSQVVSLCSDVDSELASQTQAITTLEAQVVDLQAQLAAIPPPPAPRSLILLDELNTLTGTSEATGWIQPGNSGNSNGSSAKPHGTYVYTPGQTATFAVTPAADFDNYYWYTKRKGAQYDTAKSFVQDLTIWFPTAADLAASQGVEFEVQQSLNGQVYDYAWQIRKPGTSGGLFTFDKINRVWLPTGLILAPSAWANGAKARFTAYYERNDDLTFTYKALYINGKNVLTAPVVAKAWADDQSNYISVGYQMDTNAKVPATPYTTKVERFRVTLV